MQISSLRRVFREAVHLLGIIHNLANECSFFLYIITELYRCIQYILTRGEKAHILKNGHQGRCS